MSEVSSLISINVKTYEDLKNYQRINEFDKAVKRIYKKDFFSKDCIEIINEYIEFKQANEIRCNCGKHVLLDDIRRCCFQISGYACDKLICNICGEETNTGRNLCIEHQLEW